VWVEKKKLSKWPNNLADCDAMESGEDEQSLQQCKLMVGFTVVEFTGK
jgi:hypothetical protein